MTDLELAFRPTVGEKIQDWAIRLRDAIVEGL
jgi:hypothetical protein